LNARLEAAKARVRNLDWEIMDKEEEVADLERDLDRLREELEEAKADLSRLETPDEAEYGCCPRCGHTQEPDEVTGKLCCSVCGWCQLLAAGGRAEECPYHASLLTIGVGS